MLVGHLTLLNCLYNRTAAISTIRDKCEIEVFTVTVAAIDAIVLANSSLTLYKQ